MNGNTRILVATNNQGKLAEIREIFSNFEILCLKDFCTNFEVVEDQETFEGNATKKATVTAETFRENSISDDSGICIDYLKGFPGVRTARWLAGTDRDRNLAILKKLEGLPKEKRKVNFITSIALAIYNPKDNTVTSVCKSHIIHGYISTEIRGNNGFGFDEIFELEDGRTLAELSSKEKNSMSPRKKALEEIRKLI